MDQAELDKSMKLLERVENDVGYVVASSYLPDSASTPVKGASNIDPRGLTSHIRARIARSIKAKNVNCDVCMSDPIDRPRPAPPPGPPVLVCIVSCPEGWGLGTRLWFILMA